MSNNNVVDFNFYKAIADKLKEQGRNVKDDDISARMQRIRESIARIDALMEDLKKGPPSTYEKE